MQAPNQPASIHMPTAHLRRYSLGVVPIIGLVLAALMFLYWNCATAMRFLPWSDDVMQISAGVSLYFGAGWVSTAEHSQSRSEFWAANIPLYPLLVYWWLKIFGFSGTIVRSLNYVMCLVAVGVAADAARRGGMIRRGMFAALFGVAAISDQAVTFTYRSGRGGDLLMMLVAAAALWAYTCVHREARRHALLFCCGMLVVPSGINLLPFLFLTIVLIRILRHELRWRDLAWFAAGCFAGAALLAFLLLSKHALRAFLSQTVASGYNTFGAALQAVIMRDGRSFSRIAAIVRGLSPLNMLRTMRQDWSSLPLVGWLIVDAIYLWKQKLLNIRSVAVLGLTLALLVPYGMLLAGRYAVYNMWMAAVPVCLVFSAELETRWLGRQWPLVACGAIAALVSAGLGLGTEVWRVSGIPGSEYSDIEELLRTEANSTDCIFGDPALYYAANTLGMRFFSDTYAGGRGYPRLSDAEASTITLVLVRREDRESSLGKIGGNWIEVGHFVRPRIDLVKLRRKQ